MDPIQHDLEKFSLKNEVWNEIDKRRDEVIGLCREMIKIPSDNPPGDTTHLSTFITEYLDDKDINTIIYEPKDGNQNIVATLEGSKSRPHLILNGHLDQFPSDVGAPWKYEPYSGEISHGRIFGRGAGDMKGGLAALIFSFCLVKEIDVDLPGRLTLTLVSDEETGGKWGTGWLLDNLPELLCDACLNAEPSGLTVRIGEKGSGSIRLKAQGRPAHGSFAGYAGENAIMKMVRFLPKVERLNKIRGKFTEETERVIEEAMKGFDVQYGHEGAPGMSQVLKHVTVNVGIIRGGSKVSIIPGTCEAEVDFIIPLGLTWNEINQKLDEVLKKYSSISYEHVKDPTILFPASYTSPRERIFEVLCKNAREITGKESSISFTSSSTDCRFFRSRNIPSVTYGPKAYKMAAADENITLDDLITVTKVHTGTIIEYLSQSS